MNKKFDNSSVLALFEMNFFLIYIIGLDLNFLKLKNLFTVLSSSNVDISLSSYTIDICFISILINLLIANRRFFMVEFGFTDI